AAATAPAAEPAAAPVDDLARGSAHHRLTVPGEQFDLTVDYWSTTPVTDWTLASAKTVHLSAHLVPHAGGSAQTVAFAEVTADTVLQGGELAGRVTETWTDRAPVVGDLPGYLVTADYPYEATLELAGDTAVLQQAAGTTDPTAAATLAALTGRGVSGYTLRLSYRVEVRNPGDAGFHVREVTDTLRLPLT
ncbi:hypothetical protein ACXR2U_16240, partial [Jatrophihabitans sp. YIM 134969]